MKTRNEVKALIFDKDGTLFDFNATWGAWAKQMIHAEANGDPELVARLADVLRYDLGRSVFLPDSIVVASTVHETADAILSVVPGNKAALIERMNAVATKAPQVEATPLVPFLSSLKAAGYLLGVATNDAEAPARSHLRSAGAEALFDFIVGYDSGHGGKPAPGQLHAFCSAFDLPATSVIMVGDSLHDLHAGRAAGMQTIGVLTGTALRQDLEPHADVVFDTIADIPDWIAACA